MSIETVVTTDNQFADWASSATKNDLAIYFSYDKARGHTLAHRCERGTKEFSEDAKGVRDCAVSFRDRGLVALAQRTRDGRCEYVAQRR